MDKWIEPKDRKFEGGSPWLNSGGTGPDDYVIRQKGERKWTYLVFRCGRNFWLSGYDVKLADKDRRAMKWLLPQIERKCTSDCYAIYHRMLNGHIEKVGASDFCEAHGWKDTG